MWTVRQRQGLLLILSALIVTGALSYLRNPAYVPDPQPDSPAPSPLADRVDPNTADAPSLAVVPGLGPKRAAAILAYREQSTAQHPNRPPFVTPTDLQHVRGIGPATVENVRRYLLFPSTQP